MFKSKILKRWVCYAAIGLIVLLLLIQFIPFGREHKNPSVIQEPPWSAQTRGLAKQACFDCHSSETVWPWYSSIAPVSWLVQRDVNEGRHAFNFSDWGGTLPLDQIREVVREGEMPPWFYIVMHPKAKLIQAEKDQLIHGLEAIK
jgi:cytochrome c551/c552